VPDAFVERHVDEDLDEFAWAKQLLDPLAFGIEGREETAEDTAPDSTKIRSQPAVR
jgi:hypothetical protein